MIVEPSAAELAAERRTEEQVQAMRSALDAMARHGLATDAGRLADQQFHMVMLEASRNDAVIALASSIMAALAWTTIHKQRKRELPRATIPDPDRKSVVSGKSVTVEVDLGGRRIIKKKNNTNNT